MYDENKNIIGESKIAARQGITAVVLSRILMSAPGMGKNYTILYLLLLLWNINYKYCIYSSICLKYYTFKCIYSIPTNIVLFLVISPVIMEAIEQKGLLRNMKWAPAPLQIVLCGFFLTFATPMCCALYPQISPISIDKLEPELQV